MPSYISVDDAKPEFLIAHVYNRARNFLVTDSGWGAVLYCASYLGLGLCLSVLGPALVNLSLQTDSSLQVVGYCVVARSFGYLLGSTGGGLYDSLPGHALLAAAMLLSAVGSALIPAARSAWTLGGITVFQGIGMGLSDTGANTLLIFWFGADVGPVMQTLHFVFAVGACFGPLLLRAVDTEDSSNEDSEVGAIGRYNTAFFVIAAFNAAVAAVLLASKSPAPRKNLESQPTTSEERDGGSIEVQHVNQSILHQGGLGCVGVQPNKFEFDGSKDCSIAGSSASQPVVAEDHPSSTGLRVGSATERQSVPFNIPVASPSSSASCPSLPPSLNSASLVSADQKASPVPPPCSSPGHPTVPLELTRDLWLIVLLVSIILGLYVGCETGFGAFVTAYVVVELRESEGSGQLLAAAYWAAIAAGRFASIFLSMHFAPRDFLGVSMVGCCAASACLAVFRQSSPAVWAFSCLYGLFMACIFPTAFAYAETVFPVQGKHASFFVFGSAAGEMALPSLIATLFSDDAQGGDAHGGDAQGGNNSDRGFGPGAMMWIIFTGTCANLGFFVCLARRGEALRSALRAHAHQETYEGQSRSPDTGKSSRVASTV